MVSETLSRATTALLGQDVDLAEQVIAGDQSIDERCDELTGLLKEGLTQASQDSEELEALVSILQMVPELERSADLAEHIARRTLQGLGGVITPESRGLIQSMSDVTIRMWQVATRAYQERSRDAGFQLSDADDQLDRLATQLVSQGAEGAEPRVAMDLALIARFYERLGDHAVNLARRVDAMAAPRRLSTARFFSQRPPRAGAKQAAGPQRRGLLKRLRSLHLMPTDDEFFELFQAAAANARDGADELSKLTASFSDVDAHCDSIRAIEHRGDQYTVEVLRRLDTSFITPYDREDIHALAEEHDDVVDHIYYAASLIQLAHLADPLPELSEQSKVLVAMTDELESLMGGLRSGSGARHRLERIEHLEREGDAIFRRSLGRLFSGEYEALKVIVWKDIVQAIEDSLNAVEDVSDVVESILVKNS
ncbi:MAG: transcriptional repressor for high-affinity phosphate uptake (modular protein) [Acidimicrobiaceae bacterium]|nr:transcriptional repressor for high-affinity phosphate uptake (modular protein) [Acidimicrobiaceae bacterium]